MTAGEKIFASVVLSVVIAASGFLCFVGGAARGHTIGYRNGQIDAANGKMKYASVETTAGVFWHDKGAPHILYTDRAKEHP